MYLWQGKKSSKQYVLQCDESISIREKGDKKVELLVIKRVDGSRFDITLSNQTTLTINGCEYSKPEDAPDLSQEVLHCDVTVDSQHESEKTLLIEAQISVSQPTNDESVMTSDDLTNIDQSQEIIAQGDLGDRSVANDNERIEAPVKNELQDPLITEEFPLDQPSCAKDVEVEDESEKKPLIEAQISVSQPTSDESVMTSDDPTNIDQSREIIAQGDLGDRSGANDNERIEAPVKNELQDPLITEEFSLDQPSCAKEVEVEDKSDDQSLTGLIEDKSETVNAPGTPPALDMEELDRFTNEILQIEKKNASSQLTELESAIMQARFWGESIAKFSEHLTVLFTSAENAILLSASRLTEFPADLQTELANRQQGINLSKSMIDRARIQFANLADDIVLPVDLPELPQLDADQIRERLSEIKIPDDVQKVSILLQREKSGERYSIIGPFKNLMEGRRNRLLNLIEHQILPILDGNLRGQKYTREAVDALLPRWTGNEMQIREWMRVYKEIDDYLILALLSAGISRMDIQPPCPVDFEKHQPVEVREGTGLTPETVMEIEQDGYLFRDGIESPVRVLRPANVVVAKN